MPASSSTVVRPSSSVPGPGSACTGTGAAAKPRGGDAGTPHEGSGSAPPSIPGGAPSRCTGSLGTNEAPGRDHGPASPSAARQRRTRTAALLADRQRHPGGRQRRAPDGRASRPGGRRSLGGVAVCRADDRDRPADRGGRLRRGTGGLHGVPRDVVLGQVARRDETGGRERNRLRTAPGRGRDAAHDAGSRAHRAPRARRQPGPPRRRGARAGPGWTGSPLSGAGSPRAPTASRRPARTAASPAPRRPGPGPPTAPRRRRECSREVLAGPHPRRYRWLHACFVARTRRSFSSRVCRRLTGSSAQSGPLPTRTT